METKQVTELDFSKGDRIDKIHFQLLREKGYEFEDPFDVVDIFEKKVAEYAGSKYAVAVDNGTDALFLCLTYLKKFDKDIDNIELIFGKKRQGDVPHSQASIEKAINVLSYDPPFSASKGFQKACEWYWKSSKENNYVK